MGPWGHRPWGNRPFGSKSLWVMGPRGQGALDPQGLGVTGSQGHRVTGPWCTVTLGSLDLGVTWHCTHKTFNSQEIEVTRPWGLGSWVLLPWGCWCFGTKGLRIMGPRCQGVLGSRGLGVKGSWGQWALGHRVFFYQGTVTPMPYDQGPVSPRLYYPRLYYPLINHSPLKLVI